MGVFRDGLGKNKASCFISSFFWTFFGPGGGADATPPDPHPAIFIILRITYVKKVLKSYWEIYYFFQRKWQIRTFWFIRGFFLWIFDLNYHPTDYFRPITCRFSRFLTPWKLFRLFQPYFWSFLLNHASV